MSESILGLMGELERLIPRLNVACNAAHVTFKAVETRLAEIGVGDGAVAIPRDGDFQMCLVYERICGAQRIGFRTGNQLISWENASRYWKLRGVAYLPVLLRTLVEEANDLLEKVDP